MLKIGILIRAFDTLENWELRIIENIKKDPNLTLALLIKDGRARKENIKSNYNSLNEVILKKQISIEKRRYLSNLKTVNNAEIIKYLNTIPTLKVKPKRDGDSDIFSIEDSQKVKEFNLDVILKHGFKNISGEILNVAKKGIWILIHGNHSKKSDSSGFWEILKKEPVVEVILLQLSKKSSKFRLIDVAYFNRHKYSFVETNFKVLEFSVSLLLKNLRKLNKEDVLVAKEEIYLNERSNLPRLSAILKYQLIFYTNLGKSFYEKVQGFFGKYATRWTIFIGDGNFLDADLSKIVSVKKPKDEFWADPFLYSYKGESYIFFEKFPFATQRGIISCGRIEGRNLVDIKDVLQLPYHLSYPFIFEEESEIFMMPETNANNRLEIYKCIQFPDKWELYKTAFEGERVADSFFYTDELKQKWLFLNKSSDSVTSFDNELYIYRIDSINLNKIEAHKQNPIHIDSRVARNGGAIFSHKGEIYRPSQRNVDGIYGKALNINQIEKLTIDEYIEKTIKIIKPNFQKGLVSIHHLHQLNGVFVFDAAFKNQ